MGHKVACSPELLAMKKGDHTLRLRPHRQGAQIAEVVITDDPRFPWESAP